MRLLYKKKYKEMKNTSLGKTAPGISKKRNFTVWVGLANVLFVEMWLVPKGKVAWTPNGRFLPKVGF